MVYLLMSDSKNLRTQNQPTLKLIYYRHWLALFIIGTILALLLLWAIFGKISIQATGKGIILPDQKGIYAISNPGSGVVEQVKVITGQHIEKDQVIAVIDQSKLATQLAEQRQYIGLLEKNYHSLSNLIANHKKLVSKLYVEKDTYLNNYQQEHKQYLNYLKQLTAGEEKLANQGYISKVGYQKIKQNTAELNLQLKKYLSTGTQDEIDRNGSYLELDKTLNQLQQQIESEKAKYIIQKTIFKQHKYIVSGRSGVVLSVDIAAGQYLTQGSIAATVATGKLVHNNFIAFFDPLSYSRLIKQNTAAYVVPSFLSQYQYGLIKGKVLNIDRYPQSTSSINAIVNSSALTKYVSQNNQPMLMAQIQLKTDQSTISKYAWTSNAGTPYKIPVGTLCDVKVIVEYRSPISFILPYFREAMGVD